MPLLMLVLCVVVGLNCSAESVVPLTGEDGAKLNEQLLFLHHGSITPAKDARKNVVAFPGDTVIPHVADGGSWSSSVTLANLDTRTVRVTILFFRDDGSDLLLPVVGQGEVRGMRVTLAPASTATFSTTGLRTETSSGWAYIQKESASDAVSGFCVFRQRTPGRPDFEAVVPIVSEFDSRAVLIYDNTNSFVTAAAFTNPNPSPASITFMVRAEDGTVMERRTMTLGPYSHTAGTLAGSFPSTTGRRGSIEFVTSGTFGVGVLGLRFNPSGAFTSFHALSNIDWLR